MKNPARFLSKLPFGKLFSKIIYKIFSGFTFFAQNRQVENRRKLVEGPMEIMQIRVFLKRSYKKSESWCMVCYKYFKVSFKQYYVYLNLGFL